MATYSDLIDRLLTKHGITTDEERDHFLNPSYERDLHDPFLLTDMDKAVTRVLKALKKKERIAIYSDFDADGIPAGVLLHDFFKKVGHKNFTNYIPHRDTEGYGFHAAAVEKLAKDNVTLVITADVGTSDGEATKLAKTLGTDVIITDHHLPSDDVPKALALINPNKEGDAYPCKDLCGAGVAFKLVQALLQKGTFDVKEGWEKWLLDLVAIATVADMVPLVGENRSLLFWGLQVLRKSRRPGIAALCRKLRLKQHQLTEDDIGFSIAPRINAASRLGDPETAFELLATHDTAKAADVATRLEKLNTKRKAEVAVLVKQIKKETHAEDMQIVIRGNPSWNPALLGLVANSLVEHFGKPVCLWGREGTGALKGSCRGDGTVHVFSMLESVQDSLEQFGGHSHAGGFSVSSDTVHTLPELLTVAYEKTKNGKLEQQKLDAEVSVKSAARTYKELSQLAPFGVGNPKPLLSWKEVTCMSVRQFGKGDAHVEVTFSDEEGTTLRGITFFKSPEHFSCTPGQGFVVNIVGTLEKQQFLGKSSIEVRIVDIT